MSLDGGSEAWRPPSPWRRALVVFAVLIFLGGAAAAGVYALRKPDGTRPASAAPPPGEPSAKPAGGAAPDGANAGASASADAEPAGAPHLVEAADAGTTAVPTTDPIAAPAPTAAARVITLGEGGWAVRVLLPATIVAGADVDLAVEAWDPTGAPIDARELRMLVEEPSGVERSITVPAAAQKGRFEVRRRFASAGRHQLRIFPSPGKSKPVVWFALQVEDPDATGVMTHPEPTKKSGAGSGGGGKTKGKGKGGADPYHLLEEIDGVVESPRNDSTTKPKDEGRAKPKDEASKPKEEPPAPRNDSPPKNSPPPPKKDPPPPAGGDVELE
jgi:hypothetical protein